MTTMKALRTFAGAGLLLVAGAVFAGRAAAGGGLQGGGPEGGGPQAAGAQSTMPQFTLFVWESKEEMALRGSAEKGPAYWGEYAEYAKQLQVAGAFVGGSATEPPESARRVSVKGGKVASEPLVATDSEHRLGGYFVIQAKDLDAATEWAAKCPSARTGHVEVRPNIAMNAAQMKQASEK
jgi:hypothetical protein